MIFTQHDTDGSGERTEGNGNRGRADRGGTQRHGGALPSTSAQMGQGTEDMENGTGGEVSPVPDRLHPRNRPLSLLERIRLGSKAKQRSLYGVGMPTQRPQEGTRQIPHRAQEAIPPTTVRTHTGGRDIRGPTEGRAEATYKGEGEERMDFGGHVETRRRESLRATEDKGPVEDSEAEPSNCGKPQRGQEEESRDRGRGGGSTTWGGPTNATGGMETTQSLVQGCG